VAVLVTAALFWRVRRLAGWLLVPYLLWILFATVLNWQFLELNPQADGADASYAVQRIEL
jgi:tryptophan-rich sensory protein